MKSSISKGRKYFLSTAGVLAVLICWHLLSLKFNSLILPSPVETGKELLKLLSTGQLFFNLWITVRRTLAGYFLAIILGIISAVVIFKNKTSYYIFRPLITIVQVVPPVIWLAAAIIWFGVADDLTPIFLIFIVTYPIIFINIFSGLEDIDFKLVEMAVVYSCSKSKIINEVYIPSLLPHLVSAVSIGLAFAWKTTVFAEFLGSTGGIGFALSMANYNLETAKLFAWAVVLILLMLIIEYLVIQPLKIKLIGWNENGK